MTIYSWKKISKGYNNYTIKFEYDAMKSTMNLKKHGIDFRDAMKIFCDPNLVEIPAKTFDEARSLFIGKIDQNYWSAIVSYRGERVRIISVRSSQKKEIHLYES